MSVDWDDTSGATSYSVRWQAAGPGSSPKLGVEAQSSVTSITVADYGEWVVQVGACNSVGCGPIAAQRFTVSPTGVGQLPVPLTLIARELIRGSVTLSWPTRADDGGFAITGYNIVREHTPAGSSSTVTDAIAADTGLAAIAKTAESDDGTTYTYYEYVDTDVEQETNYTYYLRAINSAGAGDDEYISIETWLPPEESSEASSADSLTQTDSPIIAWIN